ncbi:hypothetical protein HY990_00805 [Candidatus Micrarchaeota archaeon]|nr:hypothetical protein [Candidatus Micrarchaeota archaeon]
MSLSLILRSFFLLILIVLSFGCVEVRPVGSYEKACYLGGGTWNMFPPNCGGDVCVDPNLTGKGFGICNLMVTPSCDCGPTMCWSETQDKCIPNP